MILLGTIILHNIQVTKYLVTIIIIFSVHALYDHQVRSTILLCDNTNLRYYFLVQLIVSYSRVIAQ